MKAIAEMDDREMSGLIAVMTHGGYAYEAPDYKNELEECIRLFPESTEPHLWLTKEGWWHFRVIVGEEHTIHCIERRPQTAIMQAYLTSKSPAPTEEPDHELSDEDDISPVAGYRPH